MSSITSKSAMFPITVRHVSVDSLIDVSPGTDLPDLLDVGEDDVMLSLVQDPPPLREVGVHPRVLHEVLYQHIQTPQVRRFSRHHLKHGLQCKCH